MNDKYTVRAYLNEEFAESNSSAPYCVEIYLADENGDYVELIEFEYKETKEEAEKRIKEINEKGTIDED